MASSGVARKLQKVLETRSDSPELLQALEHLGTFWPPPVPDDPQQPQQPQQQQQQQQRGPRNSLEARRELREQIERKRLEINADFGRLLASVEQQLDAVQLCCGQMRLGCDQMQQRLLETRAVSGRLIEQAERLNHERRLNEACSEMAATFLAKFQLSDAELAALRGSSSSAAAAASSSTASSSAAASSSSNAGALNSSTAAAGGGEIDEAFFAALRRVHEIHANCKLLLRTQHQRAGLEIMDTMGLAQEAAYRRLYRWVKSECRTVSPGAVPPRLVHAIAALRQRPVLLGYVLDELAAARAKLLLEQFLVALTRGGPGGLPRPLEVLAHSPLRFVTGMLGWIHQAVADECDLLAMLFLPGLGSPYGADIASSSSSSSAAAAASAVTAPSSSSSSSVATHAGGGGESSAAGVATAEVDLERALEQACEPLCRPFKVRVGQSLNIESGSGGGSGGSSGGGSGDAAVEAYKVAHLLDFYRRTIMQLVAQRLRPGGSSTDSAPAARPVSGSGSGAAAAAVAQQQQLQQQQQQRQQQALADTLQQCKLEAVRVMHEQLKLHGDKLLRSPPRAPPSLAPPAPVFEAISRLTELVAELDGSVVPPAERAAEAAPVLQAVLEPVQNCVQLSASTLPQGEAAVYLVNSLHALQLALAAFDFARPRVQALQEHLDAHLLALVHDQAAALLSRCGLAQKLHALRSRAAALADGGNGGSGSATASSSSSAAAGGGGGSGIGGGGMGVVAVDGPALADSLRHFEALLNDPLALQLCDKLAAADVRSYVRSAVAAQLLAAYRELQQFVLDPRFSYEPQAILRYTPEQLQTLLDAW